MKKTNLKITTAKEELKEGLFGQVVLFIFEILPYLYSKSIFPAWDIKSTLYGTEPNYTVIPGVFDLAYEPSTLFNKEISLKKLRTNHSSSLGGNWEYMNKLWNYYFKIPHRIIELANDIGNFSDVLGVHYRGTDKNLEGWDTNPTSHEEFIILINDFIRKHETIKSIFISTDEFAFVDKMKKKFSSYNIINLGEISFHKDLNDIKIKGDRAVLDCLLLSRCKYLLKTSSALSGFAKVLNPNLECYRVSASKLFSDIPYFPDAYIPILTSDDPDCNNILMKLLEDDWLQNKKANRKFNNDFCTLKRNLLSYYLKRINTLTSRIVTYYSHEVMKNVRTNNKL